jgi:hypothetical protein
MTKKIVWGIVVFGLIGLLVAGAVVRTVAKTGDGTETRGGYGRNQGVVDSSLDAGLVGDVNQGSTGAWARGGSGDGTGTGQAQVDEWLTFDGTVVSVDADALAVLTATGEEVVVENRPWWFAQEQGFAPQPGDQVTLVGFYEDGTLEVGQIADASNGQSIQLRDESGRPMWAGRGRRSG